MWIRSFFFVGKPNKLTDISQWIMNLREGIWRRDYNCSVYRYKSKFVDIFLLEHSVETVVLIIRQ